MLYCTVMSRFLRRSAGDCLTQVIVTNSSVMLEVPWTRVLHPSMFCTRRLKSSEAGKFYHGRDNVDIKYLFNVHLRFIMHAFFHCS